MHRYNELFQKENGTFLLLHFENIKKNKKKIFFLLSLFVTPRNFEKTQVELLQTHLEALENSNGICAAAKVLNIPMNLY